jgi:hypothetical protein
MKRRCHTPLPLFPDAQRVGQRDQTHPNVMRHEGSHDRNVFVTRDTRIIERVVESELAKAPRFQFSKVPKRGVASTAAASAVA